MADFVNITKCMQRSFFVSYKQLAGALWLYFHFYGLRAKYIIQVIYCNGGRQSRWRLHGPWCYAGGMVEMMP
jgi:hypothetical protein